MNAQEVSDWDVEIRRRRATLLNNMLLVAVVGGLVAMVSIAVTLPTGPNTLEWWVTMAPFLSGWLIVLIAWVWRGLGYYIRVLVFLLLAYVLSCIVFARGGLPGSGRVWLLLLPALAFILLGVRPGIASGVVAILTYAFFTLAITQKWVVPQVAEDLTTLSPLLGEGGTFLLVIAVLTLILWSSSRGWLESLMGASVANRDLQARTRELEAANVQLHLQTIKLQTTAEIARAGSSILDPETLFTEVVNRIQEGFEPMGVYYVGLFMLDEVGDDASGQFAVLRAATGEAGRLLLEMGHKLALDDTTSIGWCVSHREARVVLGLEEGSVRHDAVPMPHTRSEVALPLHSRGRVLGALSVQSTQEASFGEADVAVLQMMADQVAVAIDNARLFSQTEAALEEVQVAHRRYLVQAWEEFLTARPGARADYTQPGVDPGDGEFLRQARRAAVVHERVVALDGSSPGADEGASASQTALVVPLKLRGQIIGTMTLHETRHPRSWQAGEIAMAETIAEQVALSVENLRLMDETQRRAAREQLVGDISDQMQRATDMEALMRITAEELNRALGGSRAYVRLGTGAELTGEAETRPSQTGLEEG